MDNEKRKSTFVKKLKSMLAMDARRTFTSPLYYIMVAISLIIPVLILVMTTMMDGSVTVDPQTGEESVMQGFTSVWQIIGTASGGQQSAMSMDMTSMCNINLLYFIVAVFVCIFVGDDFRSGYAKNLFTVRSKKGNYVISKSVLCFVVGASMMIAFFVGALIGGAVSGLSFALDGVSALNVVMCMLSKIFLVGLFSSIFVLASVIAKHRFWLAIILSLGIGMLMFSMVGIITPLNSTAINAILCLVGSALFATGIGFITKLVLNKTALV